MTALDDLPEAPHRVAARIAALKAALEFRSGATRPDETIALACQFERYLLDGETAPPRAATFTRPIGVVNSAID